MFYSLPCLLVVALAELPRVSLLFLNPDGKFRNEAVWEAWYTRADEEFKKIGEEVVEAPIDSYIHVPESTTSIKTKRLKLVEPRVDCDLGQTIQCQYQLMKYAVDNSKAEWFLLLSADSIPVKSFGDIYSALLENGRSRIIISSKGEILDGSCYKHGEWMALKRSHVLLLLNDDKIKGGEPKPWILKHVDSESASPAEYLPLCRLSKWIGLHQLGEEINNGGKWPPAFNDYPDEMPYMIVNYSGCDGKGNWKSMTIPCEFSTISESYYTKISQNSQAWFFRAVSDNLKISTVSGEVDFVKYGNHKGTDLKRLINNVVKRMVEDGKRSSNGKLARVALMILSTVGKFNNADVWRAWLDYANEDFESMGYEKAPIDVFRHVSNVDAEVEDQSYMSEIKDVQPRVQCKWGQLLPCQVQIMKYSLEHSTAKWFFLISSDTVPIRSFAEMYLNQLSNNKSLMRFVNTAMDDETSIKHSQWVVLRRDHMVILVEDSEMTTTKPAPWHGWPVAAPDEYIPAKVLIKNLTRNRMSNEVNEGSDWPPPLPLYLYLEAPFGGCLDYGLVHKDKHWPCLFDTVYPEYIIKLRNNGVWMFRKCRDNLNVGFPDGNKNLIDVKPYLSVMDRYLKAAPQVKKTLKETILNNSY